MEVPWKPWQLRTHRHPEPATDLELPALDLGVGDINIQAVGDRVGVRPWGQTGVSSSQVVVVDAQGFVEVRPVQYPAGPMYRKWPGRTKLSGWVLVAFSVTPQGNTRNVRVLDARPRGVFEEKVVVRGSGLAITGSASQARVKSPMCMLTQKVEVLWEILPAESSQCGLSGMSNCLLPHASVSSLVIHCSCRSSQTQAGRATGSVPQQGINHPGW